MPNGKTFAMVEAQNKNKKVRNIANNVLYLDDSSDYQSALWEILAVVAPELFKDTSLPELHFIEE